MDGEIGELLQVTAYYLCGLSHNGSHGIDAMRYLAADAGARWVFGEIESDEAAFAEEDPQGNGYLVFDNGVRGFPALDGLRADHREGVRRPRDRGRIRVLESVLQYELWKPAPGGPRGGMQAAQLPFPYPTRIEGMGPAIVDDIVRSAAAGSKPRCSGADARDALEVALALRESAPPGFVRVDLPLEDRSLGIVSAEALEDDLPARVRRLQAGG